MALTYGITYGSFGDEKQETSTAVPALGTKLILTDGRTFYYGQCASGAAISTAGMIVDGIAAVAAHDLDVPPTAAQSVGDNIISLEVPTTNLTKDQYKDGYLIFNDGPGEGDIYRIASHPAHVAGTDATVLITIEDEGIQTAITTATEAQLVYPPYAGLKLIDGDGTQTTGPLGITTIPMTASYYGWIQTSGLASVAMGATDAILGNGMQVSEGSGESGRATLFDVSANTDLVSIGTAIGVLSTTDEDKQLCMLNIRP